MYNFTLVIEKLIESLSVIYMLVIWLLLVYSILWTNKFITWCEPMYSIDYEIKIRFRFAYDPTSYINWSIFDDIS